MTLEFDIFTKNLHPLFLAAVEKECESIVERNRSIAYARALRNIATNLAINNSNYESLQTQLTEKDLVEIFRAIVRVASFSFGVRECDKIIARCEDPVVRFHQGTVYYTPGELDKNHEFLYACWEDLNNLEQEGQTFTLPDKMDILLSLIENTGIRHQFSKLSEYEQMASNTLEKYSEDKVLHRFYEVYLQAALCFWIREKGDLKRAEEYYHQALEGAEEFNHPFLLAWVTNSYGALLISKGDLPEALHQFKKSLIHYQSIGNLQGMAFALNNIGVIQNDMGLYKEARESFLKSKDLHLESTGHLFRTITFSNIATTYKLEGNFSEALNAIQQGLEVELQNPKPSLDLLYLLSSQIDIYIQMNDLLNARIACEKFEETINELKAATFKAQYHYFLGLIEAKELNLGSAKKEFLKAKQFTIDATDYFRTLLKIDIQLAGILILSYRVSLEREEFNQAFSLIESIIKACKEQEILPLLYEVLIIKSVLLDIVDEREQAIQELKEIVEETKNHGLLIQHKVANEQLKAISRIDLVLEKEKTSSVLKYLEESSDIITSYGSLQKTRKIDAKLYGVLISNKSGAPVYSRYFDEKMLTDDILISGLLSAVSSFTNELISKEGTGSLKSITHEDISILLEKMKSFTITFFADKDTYELRTKLMQIAHELESQFQAEGVLINQGFVEKSLSLNEIIQKFISKYIPIY